MNHTKKWMVVPYKISDEKEKLIFEEKIKELEDKIHDQTKLPDKIEDDDNDNNKNETNISPNIEKEHESVTNTTLELFSNAIMKKIEELKINKKIPKHKIKKIIKDGDKGINLLVFFYKKKSH